jgi:hypothetical protein
MFTLKLYDRNGIELKQGDIVKVSNGKDFTFYSEVKWLELEQSIAPFHTFSFHSFEKVDSVPEHAIKGRESRYDIWYTNESDTDDNAEAAQKYLSDWRSCETLIEKKCFRITLN